MMIDRDELSESIMNIVEYSWGFIEIQYDKHTWSSDILADRIIHNQPEMLKDALWGIDCGDIEFQDTYITQLLTDYLRLQASLYEVFELFDVGEDTVYILHHYDKAQTWLPGTKPDNLYSIHLKLGSLT